MLTSKKSDAAQANIVDQLEKLNQWQEQQKKLLQERQNMQRQMLGLEQKNMYQMLGLYYPEPDLPNASTKNESGNSKDAVPSNSGLTAANSEERYVDEDDENDYMEDNGASATAPKEEAAANCGQKLQAPAIAALQTKKPFLRRGEGLKQRFKIDPEELRINNLPRYKFANAHPKLNKSKRGTSRRTIPVRKSFSTGTIPPQQQKPSEVVPLKQTHVVPTAKMSLDPQERRFQHLLLSSKNAFHSTPDAKESFASASNSAISKMCLGDKPSSVKQKEKLSKRENSASSCNSSSSQPVATWKEVLDNQQIKPIPMHAVRKHVHSSKPLDEDSLSIFELLEQKANEGAVDWESTFVQNIFLRRQFERQQHVEHDNDSIPVDPQLQHRGLEPAVEDVEGLDGNLDETVETVRTEEDAGSYDEDGMEERARAASGDDEDATETTADHIGQLEHSLCSTLEDVYANRVPTRVRFAQDPGSTIREAAGAQPLQLRTPSPSSALAEATLRNNTTNMTNNSTMATDESSIFQSNEVFNTLKSALFAALRDAEKQANQHEASVNNTSACSIPGDSSVQSPTQSLPIAQRIELADQTNMIKERLIELEREIATFRENNRELMRAKQVHEMEKAHFKEKTLAALDRLNDEKIQNEIYLHDERMKLEEEKRKYSQQMKTQTVTVNNKQRKEIAQLKQEVETLQLQLKQKEQTHAASQARLRTQMKQLERDKKQLYEDIERLTKENKKLQMENAYLNREHNNNKMLQEINRNIAKLAPKLSHVSCGAIANDDHNSIQTTRGSCASLRHCHSTRSSKVNGRHSKGACNGDSPTENVESKLEARTSRRRQSHAKLFTHRSAMSSSSSLSDVDDLAASRGKSSKRCNSDADGSNSNSNTKTANKNRNSNNNNNNSEKDKEDYDNDDPEDISSVCHELKRQHSEKTASQKAKSAKNEGGTSITNDEFKREIVNADGSRDIVYSNGNIKKISADGMTIRMLYFNKDVKETNVNEGTVKYYYAETNTWHTTYLDGLEILEFPNGQTEHRHKNGLVEIHFPDNSVKVLNPAEKHKAEEWRFANGTNLIVMRNGDRIMTLANGQKEIHTQLNKRREYPDGTVKIVYPDGSQETRYSNGRVRLKDKDGKLLMDSQHI